MSKLRLGSDPFAAASGVDTLIQDTRESKQSNLSNKELQMIPSKQTTTKAGLKTGWTRATFIAQEAQIEKLRDFAYWERKDIKDVLAEALDAFFKNKKIEPRAKKVGNI